MHDRLISPQAGETRSLWDNFLESYMSRVRDRFKNDEIGNFNTKINDILNAYVSLHQQGSILYAYNQCFGKQRPADPKLALQRIQQETRNHVQAWNDKVAGFYDSYPALKFFVQEIHAQTDHSWPPINLLMISEKGKLLVADNGWTNRDMPPSRFPEADRKWANPNQSWKFEYNKDSDKWKLTSRNSYKTFWGDWAVLNDNGDLRWDNEQTSLFKIVPQYQDSKNTGRPNDYKGNGWRLGIKVDIINALGNTPNHQQTWYLDYACPSWPDGADKVVENATDEFCNANAKPGGVNDAKWGRLAYIKVKTGSNSTLAVTRLRSREGRTIFAEYAGSSYFPWRMGATSMYVYDKSDPIHRFNATQQVDLAAASGWVVLSVKDFPELAGKSQDESRLLLTPDVSPLLSYRNYELGAFHQYGSVAHVFIRIYEDGKGNRHALVCLNKDWLDGDTVDACFPPRLEGPSSGILEAKGLTQMGWRRIGWSGSNVFTAAGFKVEMVGDWGNIVNVTISKV